MAIGWDNPPEFPVTCLTNEDPPRKIKLLGTSAVRPDVWVASIEGEGAIAWVLKGNGGVCHPTTDESKVRVLHWSGEGP